MLLGVAFFAGVWLVNGLVAIVVISLLQAADVWETAAADGGPVADDLMGVALSRLGLALDGAGA